MSSFEDIKEHNDKSTEKSPQQQQLTPQFDPLDFDNGDDLIADITPLNQPRQHVVDPITSATSIPPTTMASTAVPNILDDGATVNNTPLQPPPHPTETPHEDLLLENERLKKMLNLLLLQTGVMDNDQNNNNTTHAPRLFTIPLSANNFDFIDELPIHPNNTSTTTTTTTTTTSTTTTDGDAGNENEQQDHEVHADFTALQQFVAALQDNTTPTRNDDYVLQRQQEREQQEAQRNREQRAQVESQQHNSYTRATHMHHRQGAVHGMEDQLHSFELPPVIHNHYVTEVPSIAAVQNDYFSQTTQITVVTQHIVDTPQQQHESTPTRSQPISTTSNPRDIINTGNTTTTTTDNPLLSAQPLNDNDLLNSQHLAVSRQVWQEALVLDVPRSEFWVLVPHEIGIEEREERERLLQRQLRDETGYYDDQDQRSFADARSNTLRQRHIALDNETEQFGVIVDDEDHDNEDKLLLGDGTLNGYVMLDQDLIQAHLSQYLTEYIASLPEAYVVNHQDVVNALKIAAHLQEAKLIQEGHINNTNHYHQHDPNRIGKDQDDAVDLNSADQQQQQPSSLTSNSLLFIQDCIKNREVDPQQMENLIVKPILGKDTWLSYLYNTGIWLYSLYGYASIPIAIYRNPIISRTLITWISSGVRYALVLFF